MEETNTLFQRFLHAYQKNEIIFEEGKPGNEMFIVHRGTVRIQKKTDKGEDRTLVVLERGEFFGEMALVDQSPRSASALADQDGTELLVLDKAKFTYMVQQVPAFSLAIMKRLAGRLREADAERMSDRRG